MWNGNNTGSPGSRRPSQQQTMGVCGGILALCSGRGVSKLILGAASLQLGRGAAAVTGIKAMAPWAGSGPPCRDAALQRPVGTR